MLLTVYARREPSCLRPHLHIPMTAQELRRHHDVVIYRDGGPAPKRPMGVWPWHSSRKPRRNAARVVLNCFFWKLQWLPDLALPNTTPTTLPKGGVFSHSPQEALQPTQGNNHVDK